MSNSFISWTGNNLPWNDGYRYGGVAVLFAALFILFLIKAPLANMFAQRTGMARTSWRRWRQSVGIILLVLYVLRCAFYFGGGNPLYWEGLSLHLCRIHYVAIALLLIMGRQRHIKFLLPISIAGAFFGIFFGRMTSDFINHWTSVPADLRHLPEADVRTVWAAYATSHGLDSHVSILDLASMARGVSSYSVGIDNYLLWDYYFAHLAIALVPVVIFIANHQTFRFNDFFITLALYTPTMALLWGLNVATAHAPYEWRMNNWYMAPNNNNAYHDAIGWGSQWPQNLFVYWLIGVITIALVPWVWIIQNRVVFFTSKRRYQFQDWVAFKIYRESFYTSRFVRWFSTHHNGH